MDPGRAGSVEGGRRIGPARRSEPKRVVVKTYGRGDLLGLISVPFALAMAARGMNGWQQAAVREMEDDEVVELPRPG